MTFNNRHFDSNFSQTQAFISPHNHLTFKCRGETHDTRSPRSPRHVKIKHEHVEGRLIELFNCSQTIGLHGRQHDSWQAC